MKVKTLADLCNFNVTLELRCGQHVSRCVDPEKEKVSATIEALISDLAATDPRLGLDGVTIEGHLPTDEHEMAVFLSNGEVARVSWIDRRETGEGQAHVRGEAVAI